MKPTTESNSSYENLEKMSTVDILTNINKEDQIVPKAVEKQIPKIELLATAIIQRMEKGGRLFYIGAGTSGRLGVVDASECPPTFGIPYGLVIGLIAGGNSAIRKAVEFAEDDEKQAWQDLQAYDPQPEDSIIGIAASGKTPYVIGGLKMAKDAGLLTGCITCNNNTPLAEIAEFPIEVVVGPEFITGSTRMKAGTAQKLVLNMISTSVMIGLGRVKGNKMVDMQLTNDKLIDRGERMLMEELSIDRGMAKDLLKKYGNVRKAVQGFRRK